jgi:hypothetical protein
MRINRPCPPFPLSAVPAQVKGVKVTSKGQSFVELKWAVPPAYNDDIIAFRIGYRVNKDVLDGGRDDSPFGLEIGVSRRSHSPMYLESRTW